jgi:hypothetical protein
MMDLSPLTRPSPLPRVAILIDGDNIPHSDLARVEDAGARMGRIALRRVFADIAHRKDWACETTYLIMHCTTKNGKNRADMQMTVTALDIAHRGLATAFIIASDDSDFGPLIAHLTEQGFSALRIRKSVAVAAKSDAASNARTEPVLMPEPPTTDPMPPPITQTTLWPKVEPALVTAPTAVLTPEKRVRQILAQSIDKKVPIASLNATMKGFKISDTPQKHWRNWLTAKGFVCDPKGPNAYVRLAAHGKG